MNPDPVKHHSVPGLHEGICTFPSSESLTRDELIWNVGIAAFLVIFAGFASGMTVGLLSIDPIQLRVLKESGTEEEQRQAEKLTDVLKHHHLLLVTLLLANSIAMEALPLFLNKTVPEWAAISLSVTAILLFGEIIPQALCTGRWQIYLVMVSVPPQYSPPTTNNNTQKGLPIVDVLLTLFYFLTWPIAKSLDALLGEENIEDQLFSLSQATTRKPTTLDHTSRHSFGCIKRRKEHNCSKELAICQ